MAENEKQMPSFKRKPRNTTYTVKVHFGKDTEKTFKERMQRLIAGGCIIGKCNNSANCCKKMKNIHTPP